MANKYLLTPCYYDAPIQNNDYPQNRLPVDISSILSKVSENKEVTIKKIDEITYEDSTYAISSIHIKRNSATRKMLIFTGVHGNETAGIHAIPVFLDSLFQSNFLDKWELKVIVPINPVGVKHLSRYNECGCDANRNFKKSTIKSIELQKRIVKEFMPEYLVSLHESPTQGFFCFPAKKTNGEIVKEVLINVEKKGIKLAPRNYLGKKLKPHGYSKSGFFGRLSKKIVGMRTLESFTNKFDIHLMTTETDWNSTNLFQRINAHAIFLMELFATLEEN